MISVCIATYNGEKYIKEQLNSILKQLSPTDEVIISDDESTDNTLNIVRAINSPIVHIHTNHKEYGYTPNFENALRYAKGDYIFLSDQDDVWIENKVKSMIVYLKRYDMVVSDAIVLDKEYNVIAKSFYSLRHPNKTIIGNIFKFGYLGCCMAFKRKILDKALPFPKDHKKCTHDNWLFLIGICFYKTKIIDDKLIYYCRHERNTSTGGLKPTTSLLFKINYRLYLIYNILKRR